MSGDAFTRNLFAWLYAVAADTEVSPLGFKLAFVIARHVNRQTGEAWPTQATLAAGVGATDRAVRKLTAVLRSRGHLSIISGGGRRVSNVYRLASQNPELPFGVSDVKTPNGRSPFESGNPERAFAKPRTTVRKTPNGRSYQPLEEPSDEPSKEGGASRRSRIPENWTPSEEDAAWARREGFTDTEIAVETKTFRGYYIARGTPMAKWSQAWRNWLDKSRNFRPSTTSRTQSGHLRQTEGAIEWGDE